MKPLILLLGPTASGKTALALALAQRLHAEILSCDSVAVYRHMQLGTAKPTPAERALVPHHLLDLYDPTETCTAGDYARHARAVLAQLASTEPPTLPILAGGTGLYARALLDGLFAAPPADPTLRARLQGLAEKRNSVILSEGAARVEEPALSLSKGPASGAPTTRLHRLLTRLDPHAAALVHPNDTPKLIRAIEVSLAARQPITRQWQQGRDALAGYSTLRLTLDPPRPALHARIDSRAAAMFAQGLVEETRSLIQRFGPDCRPFTSLGYAQAAAVLRGEMIEPEAIAATQLGHRQYAKRQLTWFRREAALHPTTWLPGFGDDPAIQHQAFTLAARHLDIP